MKTQNILTDAQWARITDLHTGDSYTVTKAAECRGETDRSAYESAVKLNSTVSMGKTIVELLP